MTGRQAVAPIAQIAAAIAILAYVVITAWYLRGLDKDVESMQADLNDLRWEMRRGAGDQPAGLYQRQNFGPIE